MPFFVEVRGTSSHDLNVHSYGPYATKKEADDKALLIMSENAGFYWARAYEEAAPAIKPSILKKTVKRKRKTGAKVVVL